jgi:predicted acyl esterase
VLRDAALRAAPQHEAEREQSVAESSVMNIEVKPAAAAYKLKIEKDVDVPMRDGARLKADVFRPDDGGKFPAILNLGPTRRTSSGSRRRRWRRSRTRI